MPVRSVLVPVRCLFADSLRLFLGRSSIFINYNSTLIKIERRCNRCGVEVGLELIGRLVGWWVGALSDGLAILAALWFVYRYLDPHKSHHHTTGTHTAHPLWLPDALTTISYIQRLTIRTGRACDFIACRYC